MLRMFKCNFLLSELCSRSSNQWLRFNSSPFLSCPTSVKTFWVSAVSFLASFLLFSISLPSSDVCQSLSWVLASSSLPFNLFSLHFWLFDFHFIVLFAVRNPWLTPLLSQGQLLCSPHPIPTQHQLFSAVRHPGLLHASMRLFLSGTLLSPYQRKNFLYPWKLSYPTTFLPLPLLLTHTHFPF